MFRVIAFSMVLFLSTTAPAKAQDADDLGPQTTEEYEFSLYDVNWWRTDKVVPGGLIRLWPGAALRDLLGDACAKNEREVNFRLESGIQYAALVLYCSRTEVRVHVPAELNPVAYSDSRGVNVGIEVTMGLRSTPPIQARLAISDPRIFAFERGFSWIGTVFHEDGQLVDHWEADPDVGFRPYPAKAHEVLRVYATGLGYTPLGLFNDLIPIPLLAEVRVDGLPAEVLAVAPVSFREGFPPGTAQITFRVPEGVAGELPLVISTKVGGSSNRVRLIVEQ